MAEVLLVEDKESLRTMLAETLVAAGYEVEAVSAGDEAVRRLTEGRRYALLLTDLRLPGADGMAVLDAALQADPGVPVVVLTGFGTVETAVEAMKRGAADFLSKPVDPELLTLLVERHVKARRSAISRALLAEEAGLKGMPRIIGSSPVLAEALERIRRAAATEATVLLLGESGTGKELFARALHALSARAGGPFVAVNVAALPESLVENELFGHERGAYTGASERRAGRFELADGGTLFLDEIGELPLAAQTKLLRVVEEKIFLRVGGTAAIRADVRLVAATNRELLALVKSGRFRQDLYYRLEVFPVRLPALRARREDVPALAREFAANAARDMKRRPLEFSPAAQEKLMAHDWPGNVRELRNVIERAVILASGDLIKPSDIVVGVAGDPQIALPSLDGPLEETMERWLRTGEVARIRLALERSGGDRMKAAEELGIPLKKLVLRMKELKI
ncbi:MAG: sigma-54-dependent Fis family transcriptional regulator [Acidobacteria bacterium]|nr:sigma-54-dependent Fis family transcriptional regulator [Acidobacteriota bacterium]MCG3192633.1 Transcriptional regulatory protein ZraR [Thermoanaerobaculia bacterium]MCK6684865.1 sigma-54 dependent transcriptional regulator [Thermoanaerobaculia bacterium]